MSDRTTSKTARSSFHGDFASLPAAVALGTAFLIWVLTLVPSEPASSPIRFVYNPIGFADPGKLANGGPETGVATLVFGGDVMQHRNQQDDDFDASYAGIREVVSRADLALCNLEFPVDPSKPVGPEIGSVVFNGSPRHLTALAQVGMDILITSNNHAFDGGLEGLRSTIDHVRSAGMTPIGTAQSEEELDRLTLFRAGGLKLAIRAYTYTVNPIVKGGEYLFPPRDLPIFALNFADWQGKWRVQGRKLFEKHVSQAREAGSEFLIAFCHWGQEWHFQPDDDQIRAAHDLIDSGFDLVVGSHSHVLQGAEIYKGKLIVYSLGNLNADFAPWQARTGALLKVVLSAGPSPEVIHFSFIPTYIEREGHLVTLLDRDEEKPGRRSARMLADKILGPAARSVSAIRPNLQGAN